MLPARHPLDDAVDQPLAYRVEMTVSCRDCDVLPKADGAGSVVLHDGIPVQVMHNGLLMRQGGYYGDWMTEIIERLGGHHEPQEELAFAQVMRLLPAEATMIELGAFWSYYSLWFLSESPDSRRAVAMEPDPGNLEVGRANAAINGLAPAFVQGFVGRESAASVDFASETAGTIAIPRYTVEQLMTEHEIDELTVLHCDTQGAEVDVLESCRELVSARRLQWLLVSTHSHHISGDPLSHQKCLALILELGGTVLLEHDVHESFSGDGMIVAHFGESVDWQELSISYNRTSTSLFRPPLLDLHLEQAHVAALNDAMLAESAETARLRLQVERLERRLAKARSRASGPTTPAPIGTEVRRLARRAAAGARRRIRRGA